MTTPTDSQEKTRGKAGLVSILGEHQPATAQTLQDDELLKKLHDILEPNRLLDIKTNLSVNQGELLTTDMVGLVLHNKDYEPVNLLCMPPNGKPKDYVVTDPFETAAFIIGTMDSTHELIAVDNIADAVELSYLLLGEPVTILASRDEWSFNDMVKHFSQDAPVTVMTTADVKDKFIKPLIGSNVRAIITSERTVLEHLEYGPLSYQAILALDDTKIIDLKTIAWPTPEPLSSDPSKPTRYPIEAWDGLLKKVIIAVSHYAQVPLAMAGQCVLGALAHIGQQFVNAPHGDRHNPASLILVTEGESGSGKTETMNLTHLKIDEHEKRQYQLYLTDLETWEKDKASLTGKERQAFLDNTPKPYNPETVFKDATIETILDKYVNLEIINASWATDDAAQFFNGHSMTSKTAGNALTSFTDLYSGGVVNRSRSQKNAFANPRTKAFNARLTLMLMAQRIILEPALSDPLLNGQGFLARALIACPEDLRGYRTWNDPKRKDDKAHNNPDLIAYWSRCESLLNPSPANLPIAPNGEPERIKIQWADSRAKQVFDDHKQAIENRQRKGGVFATLKAYASRMAENASRIASLIAFFDERTSITVDDVTRAFMLVEYSTAERLRYLDATPTGEQNDSEKLSSWLVDKAKGKNPMILNRTYIYNGAPKPMRKNNKILQSELDNLESMGHIKQADEGKKKVIYINPKLNQ